MTRQGRLIGCGRKRIAPTVVVRVTDGHAGFVGLLTCGLVWLCPVCSAKIAVRRGLELAAGFAGWMAAGNSILFGTHTAQHHLGHQLQPLLDGLVNAWRQTISGRPWEADKELIDYAGLVRVLEVLHGRNGWHPHLHTTFMCEGRPSADRVEAFRVQLNERWKKKLDKRGYRAMDVGQKLVQVTPDSDPSAISHYLAKLPEGKLSPAQSLGFELTSSQTKNGRSVGRTQWQLGASAVAGNSRDAMLWRQFEDATKSRAQMTWTRGLRKRLALGVEKSDEEIASEVLGTEADAFVAITPEGWSKIIAVPGLPHALLRVMEQSYSQFLRVLDHYAVEYMQIREATS